MGSVTIGVDLGDRTSRVCVLGEDGEVIEEGRVRTTRPALRRRLGALASAFRERGVIASSTVIGSPGPGGDGSFADRLVAGMQALRGATFRPNVVFLRVPGTDDGREGEIRKIVREADVERIGTVLYAPHPVSGLGERRALNVWIRDRSPYWRISWDIGNLDLSLLIALKIRDNWDARPRLLMAVEDPGSVEQARGVLGDLVSLARPHGAELHVEVSEFESHDVAAPAADLNLFGLVAEPDLAFVRRAVELSRSSCLFVRDSGQESVLA